MTANPVRLGAIKDVQAYEPPAAIFDVAEETGASLRRERLQPLRDEEAAAQVGLQVGRRDDREGRRRSTRPSPTSSPPR